MDKEKQIKELAKDLGIAFQISQTTNFGNVAEILVNAGYRKSSDLAKELMEKLDSKLNELAMEYANAGHKSYFAVCEVIYHKVLKTVFKEYEKE